MTVWLAILLGVGIVIAVLTYCVFEIGAANILIFEKLCSKLSRKGQYILLGIYVLLLVIFTILTF